VISFLRRDRDGRANVVVVANLTPVPREGYRIGVPYDGFWKEALNSDAAEYGGSGMGNMGGLEAEAEPVHGFEQSLALTLPPLSIVVLHREDI